MGKDPEDQQCVYVEVFLELNSLVETQTLTQVPLIGFFPTYLSRSVEGKHCPLPGSAGESKFWQHPQMTP